MPQAITLIALFAVATSVAFLVRWLKVPYTVALVATGLTLGATHALPVPHLTKELVYSIFLPGLVFEAAFHLHFERYLQNKLAIHALALPGVLSATALTALLIVPAARGLHLAQGFSLWHGLVFGALISATDPIAVVALFRTLGAPKRLAVLIEGESLLNDGTAAVLFTIFFGVAVGAHTGVGEAIVAFVRQVGLAVLLGAALGYAASMVIQRVDDAMIEISITTIVAYGSFVLAEELAASGVLATVAAGMVCGNYATRTGMSPSTRIAVEGFWEYLAFVLNSFVFLILGFEVRFQALLASWQPILLAWVAVTVGRALVVAVVGAALRPTRERLPARWGAILVWGGQRGALSMVLALALPADFPNRDLIVTMTYGVVTLSILLQGVSTKWMLKRLGLAEVTAERHAFDRHRAAARAVGGVLHRLTVLVQSHRIAPIVAEQLRLELEERLDRERAALDALRTEHGHLRIEEERHAREQLLYAEKEQLLEFRRAGLVGEEAFEELTADVDARLHALRGGDGS